MFLKSNKELKCILSLSVSFMLLFAADNTMQNMQKTVVSSIAEEKPGFHIEGYTVSGITYTLFAISLWFGVYINYALGARTTMVISAIGYLCYVGSYAIEDEWVIYAGAIIVGCAAGTLWPAQGHYMIENSSPKTTSRNVALFWLIFTSSNLVGNLFVYLTFYGKKYIDQTTRRTAVYFLVAINIAAIIMFKFLPKSVNTQQVNSSGDIKKMKKCWEVMTSPKMMWMLLTFSYAGLQQSFIQGIYSPSIGFTLEFGDYAKQLVPLSGIFMSFGALLGAVCPLVLTEWIQSHHYARRVIVLAGCVVQLIAYLIIFINLPNSAVFGNTEQISLIHPSVVLALLCSVLLTFGDSCLTTQIFSFIGDTYRHSSAEACALYKCIKSILVAVSFYGCSHLGLHIQLAILTAMAVVGGSCFWMADLGNETTNSCQSHPEKSITGAENTDKKTSENL